jgi:putative membrane protein
MLIARKLVNVKTLLKLAFYATSIACLGTGAAEAQSPASTPTQASAPAATAAAAGPAMSTPAFVQAMASMDAFEQRAAKVAMVMGNGLEVRKYSHSVTDDYAKSAVALSQAVAQAQLPAPTTALSAEQDATVKALYTVASKDFDRTYMTGEVNMHQQALTAAQAYAASGDNPAVKAVASSLAATLQRHLNDAKTIASRVR